MMSKFLQWISNNKMLMFLGLTTLCLLISTVVLSSKSNCASGHIMKSQNGPSYLKLIKKEDIANKSAYYRLPRHVIPKNYKLFLNPDLTTKTFGGTVTIALETTKPTKDIILHSKNLSIISTEFRTNRNTKINIVKTFAAPDTREFFIITLGMKLPKGKYELDLKFEGRLDRGFIAFYASTLKNGGNDTNHVRYLKK